MPDDPKILNGVNAFLRWKDENNVKLLHAEKMIYSRKYDYTGLVDIIAEVNGERCIVDIKTSNGIYDEMRLQVAAYMHAEMEETGDEYAGRWIIRLGKEPDENGDPDVEAVYLDEKRDAFKRDFKAFLAAKTLYDWQQANKPSYR